MTQLSDYLYVELKKRKWSQRELARRSGMSPAQVSDVVGDRSKPGADFCISVAKALDVNPEHLLRLAGILPSLPERGEDHWLWRTWSVLEDMSPEDRRDVIAYAMWRRSQSKAG